MKRTAMIDRPENPYTDQKIFAGDEAEITPDPDAKNWYIVKGYEFDLCLPKIEVEKVFGEL